MMQQKEQDLSRPQGLREQYAAGLSWLALLCQVLEASVVVFLRHGFGARYLGGQAAAVIPLVLVFTLFWEGHEIRPLLWFLGLYLLACFKARIGMVLATRRGEIVHSYYSGLPNALRWRVFRGRLSEKRAKLFVDPACTFLMGAGFMPVSEPLGAYLMVAAAGLMFSAMLSIAYQNQRVQDARDAYIAQQADAERFREGGWR